MTVAEKGKRKWRFKLAKENSITRRKQKVTVGHGVIKKRQTLKMSASWKHPDFSIGTLSKIRIFGLQRLKEAVVNLDKRERQHNQTKEDDSSSISYLVSEKGKRSWEHSLLKET